MDDGQRGSDAFYYGHAGWLLGYVLAAVLATLMFLLAESY